MVAPGTTLTLEQLDAWKGRTFGELKKAFGSPTSSTLGEWAYRPRRLPNLYSEPTTPQGMPLENYPPILVVNSVSGSKFPWVFFRANTRINPETVIMQVRMLDSYN